MAPHVVNYDEYRAHLLTRLARQVNITGDPAISALYDEVRRYAGGRHEHSGSEPIDVVLPLRLRSPFGELSLFSTIAVFGTPVDITLDELAIESFFPADEHTSAVLHEHFASGT
jgi:hypothetical protein